MKALSLKFNTYVKSVDAINNNIEKKLLNIFLWSFAGLAFLYVVFLGNMVSNIVERRSLEAEGRTLSSVVSSLELTYLSMSNDVDFTLSSSLGFKETKPIFATRKSVGFKSEPSVIKVVKNDL